MSTSNLVNPFRLTVGGGGGGDWYDNDWSDRIKITIDATQVASTLTNFPLYVDLGLLPYTVLQGMKSDGADIRCTTSDGTTEIAREVVSIDIDAKSGEMYVLIPGISSSVDTEFYIYYGNAAATEPAATATYGSEAVWADYAMVMHMTDETDSTGNYTWTNNGMTAVDGKLGGSLSGNGTSNYMEATSQTSAIPTNDDFTLQYWMNRDTWANGDVDNILSTYSSAGTTRFWNAWYNHASNGRTVRWGTNAADTYIGGTFNTNTWYMFHGTIDASATLFEGFIDGAYVINDTSAGNYVSQSDMRISRQGDLTAEYWDGEIDELRIRHEVLSDDWIATEFKNQNRPLTLYECEFASSDTVSGHSTLPTGLVAYYTLDESSGSTFADSVGSADLTVSSGFVGHSNRIRGMSFDAKTSGYAYSSGIVLASPTDYSVSVWFKSFGNGTIIAQTKDSNTVPAPFDIQLNAGTGAITVVSGNGTSYSVKTSSGSVWTVGEWNHLVLTFDDSANDLNVYINASVVYNVSETTTIGDGTSGVSFNICSQRYTTAANRNAAIVDEIGIWSKVLTSGEVSALYNSGDGIPYS